MPFINTRKLQKSEGNFSKRIPGWILAWIFFGIFGQIRIWEFHGQKSTLQESALEVLCQWKPETEFPIRCRKMSQYSGVRKRVVPKGWFWQMILQKSFPAALPWQKRKLRFSMFDILGLGFCTDLAQISFAFLAFIDQRDGIFTQRPGTIFELILVRWFMRRFLCRNFCADFSAQIFGVQCTDFDADFPLIFLRRFGALN